MYRLIINCFISISVLNLVQGNTGETPDGTIIDTPEELPTLAQCKLKSVDGGSVKGVPELQGPKGPPGEVGSPGIKGEIGPQGQEGPKGNDGATGEPGSNGLPGIKGIIGLQGDQGETGVQGKAGPAGIKGILGQKGSRGDPGFAVYKLSEDKSSKDDVETRGSKKNPLREVCKYEGAVPEADKHYLQPRTGSDLWQVHCENKNLETCILPKSPVTIEIKSDKPFWLSEIAGSAVDNLYGVTIEQLEWLQRRSAFIKQTIRYYCFNSVPIHDDESKTLKLLTWNNVIIGEKPSATTPFYYEVIKDECKNSKDKKDGSKYTEIEIKSSNVNRLPILDIQINDVNGGDQKHMIEHIKLCFM